MLNLETSSKWSWWKCGTEIIKRCQKLGMIISRVRWKSPKRSPDRFLQYPLGQLSLKHATSFKIRWKVAKNERQMSIWLLCPNTFDRIVEPLLQKQLFCPYPRDLDHKTANIYVKKPISLKLSVRTTWWSQTSKTAKIFWRNPRWGSERRSLQADFSWQSLTYSFDVMRWYYLWNATD